VRRLLCTALALFATCSACAQEVANGVFLVAQPTLTEPTFRVIINRPTELTLREAFPKHEHIAAQPHTLHFGGPVQPQSLLFLVRSATPPSQGIPVLRDVYLTGDADWVDNALATEQVLSATRVFAGYAGWAPGQLRSEMERQGWYILPADSETIFDKPLDEVWGELVRRAVLRLTIF